MASEPLSTTSAFTTRTMLSQVEPSSVKRWRGLPDSASVDDRLECLMFSESLMYGYRPSCSMM